MLIASPPDFHPFASQHALPGETGSVATFVVKRFAPVRELSERNGREACFDLCR